MGNYSLYKANQQIVPADDPKRWPRDCDKIQVWKLEEKQSDVNLALHLYDDALNGEVDQVVLVTNDTDLALALEILKVRCPHSVRGLVIPTRKAGRAVTLNAKQTSRSHNSPIGSGGISRRMSCAPHNCHMSFLAAAAPASSHTHGMRNRITLRRCWKWPGRFCVTKVRS
nr:NYN domain-containing protein [Rhizobium grahamii]